MTTQVSYNPQIVQKNAELIATFFDACDKETYLGMLRDMFDSYLVTWRFKDAAPLDKENSICFYRLLEKLITDIEDPAELKTKHV
jgi:hypothetical protein